MSIDIEPRKARTRPQSRLRRARPAAEPSESPETTPAPPRVPGRRNPKWIALGVVALCLGGLLSYVIYARLANETAVVSVAQTVYRGEVIDAADLTTITLQGSTMAQAVPAADLDTMIGKRAAVDLVAGSVLVASAVTERGDSRRRSRRRRAQARRPAVRRPAC